MTNIISREGLDNHEINFIMKSLFRRVLKPRTSKQCPYFNRAKTEESKVKIHAGYQMISILI